MSEKPPIAAKNKFGDIAILELDQELNLETYTPACLAKKGDNFVGKSATAAGWGRLTWDHKLTDAHFFTDVPHEVQLPVTECRTPAGVCTDRIENCEDFQEEQSNTFTCIFGPGHVTELNDLYP